MNRDRHRRLLDLFLEVVDLSQEERNGVLDAKCAGDTELKREVEELVAADTGEEDWGGSRQVLGVPKAVEGAASYRIVEELGRGGSGVVCLAERADGSFSRRVALKILQSRIGSQAELEIRFRSERQILASFDHPNIARLLDAGTLPDGSPFLVMEYVEGEPINRWVRTRDLSVEQRLHLFLKVCDAVQAAHESLVVHRDLKPSNVLVAEDGTPKLLDFGIAKLLDPGQADWTLAMTGTGGQPMTPRYASPEQLEGASVTTATDVYGLGLLLYELLTEQSPYRPSSQAIHHWFGAISSQEPRRPSTAVGDADQTTLPTTSERENRRLRRRLEGDLDHILLKALRKEPKLRYSTAADLADDLRRHLAGQPIEARRGSFSYRAERALRRHALGLSLALLVLLAGVAFTLGLMRQVKRTELERDKARAVTDLLVGVFDSSGPSTAAASDPPAHELLGRGLARLRGGSLDSQPAVKGALLDAAGQVYNNLGRVEDAEEVLTEALEVQRARRDEEPMAYVKTLQNLAVVYMARARYDQAESMQREALEVAVREVGERDLQVVAILDGLAHALSQAGRHDEAVVVRRRVLRLTLQSLSLRSIDAALAADLPVEQAAALATQLSSFGAEQRQVGDYLGAEESLQQALDIHREIFGDDHFVVAFDLNNLANVYSTRDRHQRAVEIRGRALATAEQAMGAEHPSVASIRLNQGYDRHRVGESEQGLDAIRQASDTFVEHFGPRHPAVAMAQEYAGTVLLSLGRPDEALDHHQLAWEVRREVYADENVEVARSLAALAWTLHALERLDESVATGRSAAAIYERILGEEHPDTLGCLSRLAEPLLDQDRAAEAIELLEPVVAVLESRDDLPWRRAWARFRLARALVSESHQEATEARARRLAEAAAATFRDEADIAAATEVDSWLAARTSLFQRPPGR